jgi:hypothetical protein
MAQGPIREFRGAIVPVRGGDLFGRPVVAAAHTRYEELGIRPDASHDEVPWARSEVVRQLQEQQRALRERLERMEAGGPDLDPPADGEDAVALGERLVVLQDRINEVNGWEIDRPDKRLAYDCGHPPLALLRLEESGSPGLSDVHTSLLLLRRSISEFLTEAGEEVFHPSDLTRQDFSDDFSRNPVLDEQSTDTQ